MYFKCAKFQQNPRQKKNSGGKSGGRSGGSSSLTLQESTSYLTKTTRRAGSLSAVELERPFLDNPSEVTWRFYTQKGISSINWSTRARSHRSRFQKKASPRGCF